MIKFCCPKDIELYLFLTDLEYYCSMKLTLKYMWFYF